MYFSDTGRYKKLKIFGRIFLVLNIFAASGLVLSYLASYISPSRVWVFGFFGLAYSYLLAINTGFVCYWLLRRKKIFLLSLLTILAGIHQLSGVVQFNFFRKPPPDTSLLKVMSYNVRLFDLYNWSHNVETRNRIFDMFRQQNADVMCFQEFYTSAQGVLQNIDTLVRFQKAHNAHVEITDTVLGIHFFGIATFSSYPIVGRGKFFFGNAVNNACIFTDIKIGTDTVRVYNIHLQSVHLRKEDYNFVENFKLQSKDEKIAGSKKIFHKLKNAFIKRGNQAEKVKQHIAHSPYPVIVCGDFNDLPSSYAYHVIADGLSDAFRESGWGFSNTYIGSSLPSFRIDYILHDKQLQSYDYRTIRKEYSDHYPVVCSIGRKK